MCGMPVYLFHKIIWSKMKWWIMYNVKIIKPVSLKLQHKHLPLLDGNGHSKGLKWCFKPDECYYSFRNLHTGKTTLTFPKFQMMLNAPWHPWDHIGWLIPSETLIDFCNICSTITALSTMFWIKPETNQLLDYPEKNSVHWIDTNTSNNVKAR